MALRVVPYPPKFADHAGKLFLQEEEAQVTRTRLRRGGSRSMKPTSINPVLKAWIDNVIVPALADQWAAQASGMLSV